MTGEPIVLVNRCDAPLSFVADGRHYELAPGDNHGYVSAHARFAMAQNPIFGTEDYYSLEFASLVGVKGQTPCDPIPDEILLRAMENPERFDRVASGLQAKVAVAPKQRMPKGRFNGMSSGAGSEAFAVGHP